MSNEAVLGSKDNPLSLSIGKLEVTMKDEKKEEKKPEKKEEIEIPKKSRWIAIILAFFFGRFGLHHLYLGRPTLTLVYLIFSRYDIMILVGIIEAFIYYITDPETWNKDHGVDKVKK